MKTLVALTFAAAAVFPGPEGSAPLPVTPAPVQVIEVRQSGGLTPDTINRVKTAAALNGAMTSDLDLVTLRLLQVRRNQTVLQLAPDGFGFPMLVSSIDTASPLVPAELGDVLDGGRVVMGEATAALRGAAEGDIVTMETLTGGTVEIVIGAIVPDDQLFWTEVMVGEQLAVQLGIDRPFVLFVWGENLDRVESALVANQFDPTVRVAGPDSPPMSDPVLPVALVKQRFGEFAIRPAGGDLVEVDPAWKEANIVTVDLAPLGLFECHRLLVPYFRGVVDELHRTGLISQLDPADFQLAGGCFNARFNRGADPGFSLSRHSWGIAIDVNPSSNQFGAPPTLSSEVVEVFRRWGFSWGGTWFVPDGMHFEWRRLPLEYMTACADLSLAPLYAGGIWYLRPAAHVCG